METKMEAIFMKPDHQDVPHSIVTGVIATLGLAILMISVIPTLLHVVLL